jgi:RHS repeat-associated protein
VKRILPLGQVETYSYATDGNLQSKTDFNGKMTTFAYDNMQRLMAKTPDASLNEPAVSFTYNDLGQRASMTDASGMTNYLYDSRNRLQSKATPNGTLSYTYDESGSIKTVRSNHTNGVSVDYSYDELNRLQTVKDNRLVGNQTTSYTYDAVGNLQSYSYPNQVTTSYAYNNLNRLTTLTVSNTTNGLASYAYTLGASGNRTQVVEGSGRTVNYAYDDLYRLTSETIANSDNNGQVSYGYDAVGNRLNRSSSVAQVPNQSSTFDANDRLNSDVFDANGSTKQSNGKSYNYDFENKLTSTSDGVTIVYDGDGNRVSKTVGGVTTKYLVDTNNLTGYSQVVEEIVSGQVTKQYTYGHDLISQRQSSGVSFYNYDGHGSVRGLSNLSGAITDTYDYDAFGTLIGRTGTTANNYLYAGEQFDADLGFYYNRARYLNVQTGRFISQDSYEGSSSDPQSLHKYLYANSDGVDNVDPSGNITIAQVVIALVIVASISAAIYFKFSTRPISVSWKWENDWNDINTDGRLSDSEIQTVKEMAYLSFNKAYAGFNVKIVENSTATRGVHVSKMSGDPRSEHDSEMGATYGTSRESTVFYPGVMMALKAVVKNNNLVKSRGELIEALGRGIGATAAHELGHQYGLAYTDDIRASGYYDTFGVAENAGPEHFFGELRWSETALKKIEDNISRTY